MFYLELHKDYTKQVSTEIASALSAFSFRLFMAIDFPTSVESFTLL